MIHSNFEHTWARMSSRNVPKLDYKSFHVSSTASEHEAMAASRRRKTGANVWQAEEILAEKKIGRHTKYLIKWAGFGTEDCTWEPRENLLDERLLLAGCVTKQRYQNIL
uniref:Chromo domain-containing protein n=2 Tax=Clytia hemisphaerica TaxID=252671 RepID=A0A7M5XM07_9CNID